MLTCNCAAADLFQKVRADCDTTSEAGMEAGERDVVHEATLRAEASYAALMNKLYASAHMLLRAVQLPKELNGGGVASSLR